MKISELESGKTYYQSRKAKSSREVYSKFETAKYFVLEVNSSQVLASCNGASPIWYNSATYKHWVKTLNTLAKAMIAIALSLPDDIFYYF